MGNLNVGDRFVVNDDMDMLEQNRLQALIDITEEHSKEVNQLKSRLETAEKKAGKLDSQIKSSDSELKSLRVHNPDRMKKQIKRLQEQNRLLTGENTTLKVKQKQLTQQLDSANQELELLREKEAAEKKEDENENIAASTDAGSEITSETSSEITSETSSEITSDAGSKIAASGKKGTSTGSKKGSRANSKVCSV